MATSDGTYVESILRDSDTSCIWGGFESASHLLKEYDMPKTLTYDKLPFLPELIASTVCGQIYRQQEFSEGVRSQATIDRVEAKRLVMTPAQIEDFSEKCDAKCEGAFNAKAKWFMDCVKARDNSGRDQLYVWIRHWMVAYLDKGTI